jgi:hypothetical protein
MLISVLPKDGFPNDVNDLTKSYPTRSLTPRSAEVIDFIILKYKYKTKVFYP